MKSHFARTLFPLLLLLFLGPAPRALSYYDPGAQRWINRDPVGERGGMNLHRYCLNTPFRYLDPFGLNTVCVDSSCAGVDLSAFTYIAEEEPHPPGQPEPPKVLRQMPPPGQCVEADGVYEPGKATKVSNCGTGTITCSGGKPEFKYTPCVPFKLRGDGCVWNYGDPPPPPKSRWPAPHLPPYKDKPPVQPLPPLNLFPAQPPPQYPNPL
jgi:hypothetical protein